MRKGISLITLIITIVVIIILAATVILNLTDNNPINSAKVANLLNSKESIQDSILLYNSNIFLKISSRGNNNAQYSYFLGVDDSSYRIVELNDGIDSNKYEISDIKSTVINKGGEELVIYKLDKNACAEHEITLSKTPTNESAWYVSEKGEVYLAFEKDISIPEFIKKALPDNSVLERMIVVLGKEEDKNKNPYDSIEESASDMFLYTDNGDGTVTLSGLNSNYTGQIPEALKLPVSKDNKTITKIGERAISSSPAFSNVKILVVPEGIKEIGLAAFGAATNIEELYLPSTLERLGVNVFVNSKSLKKITLPDAIVSNGVKNNRVSDQFGASKTYIEEVNFSGKITAIGNYAFDGFTGLKSVNFTDSIQSIGNYSFRNCTALTGEVVIPAEITQIGQYAFSNCKSISSINFTRASKLTTIGRNAFSGNESITEVVLPEGLIDIGIAAFSSDTNLTNVTIPESVTTIGSNAFGSCNLLTQIKYKGSATGSPWGASKATIVTDF